MSLEQISRTLQDILARLDALEAASEIIYSKGSYTPTYTGGTAAGVTTYTVQTGEYVRIGRVVIAKGHLTWTAATGTGQARISLPFAAQAGAPATIWTSNVTFGALTPYGLLQDTVQYLTLWTPANNAASVAINVEAAGDILFSVAYFI